MANYVVNYQKKIRIRQEKEDKLRRLIAKGADEELLLTAAEMVREARIRELNAQKAKMSPQDTPERLVQINRLDGRIEALRATTPEAILAEFKSEKPQPYNQAEGVG